MCFGAGRCRYPQGQTRTGGSDWSAVSDFTNEMGGGVQTGRVGKKGHPCPFFLKLPSMAILPWAFDHFISEIADSAQQSAPPRPCPSLGDIGNALLRNTSFSRNFSLNIYLNKYRKYRNSFMDLGSHGSVGIAGRVTQESGAGAAWGGIFSVAYNQQFHL